MARSPIGYEVPCERRWLVGGREEEVVSRVTGGQGAAAEAAGLRSAGRSVVRDRLEAEALRSRVSAGRSPLRHLSGAQPGQAAWLQDWPGESLLRNWTSREEWTWGCSVLGSGGRAERELLVGRRLAGPTGRCAGTTPPLWDPGGEPGPPYP